jgi:type IV secretion system protein VirD4
MVSRQETARPLLTPGEVMQLPPDEAVVMVSSVAPIKAKKLRYYADAISSAACCRRLRLRTGSTPTRRRRGRRLERAGDSRRARRACHRIRRWPGAWAADDGGPRRQPELSETVAYDPELAAPAADLALLDDDDDLPLPLPRQLDPAMQRTARLASLDPNDGIEL